MADLGFVRGARTLFSAFGRVARNPAYWPSALVPPLIFSVLGGAAGAVVLQIVRPALTRALDDVTTIGWLNQVLVWVGVLGTLLAAALIALVLTTPLSAPALERLVARTEADLGAPARAPLGLLEEMWCGLRAQAAPLLWTLPAWVLLLAVDALVPILSPLTVTARALLTAFGVAWALIDYPLTLRGVGIRERLRLFRRNLVPVLGFGAAFALLFWLPCCGIVFLGVGVVGATELSLSLAAPADRAR